MPDPIVEILTKGATYPEWTDITADVRGPVSWRRGIASNRATADPSTCDLTLDNLTGRFNPRNPASDLYGSIGVGTPVRVRLDASAPALPTVSDYEQATSSTSSITVNTPTYVAGDMLMIVLVFLTATAPVALPDLTWDSEHFIGTNNSMQVMWKLATDVAEPASQTFSIGPPGTLRTRALFMAISDAAPLRPIVTAQSYGTAPPFVPTPRGLTLYGASDRSAFAVTPTPVTANWNALDSALGTTWSTLLSNIGGTYPSLTVVQRSTPGDDKNGESIPGTFDSAQFAGLRGHELYFSIAIYAQPDPNMRYVGLVNTWPQDWEAAGSDATTSPDVRGVLDQLAGGEPASAIKCAYLSRSAKWAPYIATDTFESLGYWPLETDFGNAAASGSGPAASGSLPTSFAQMEMPGTEGGLQIGTGTTTGRISFPVNWTTQPLGVYDQFTVEFSFEFPADATTGTVLVAEYGATRQEFLRLSIVLAATTWSYTLDRIDYSTGASNSVDTGSGFARTPGDWHSFRNTLYLQIAGAGFIDSDSMVDGVRYSTSGSVPLVVDADAQPSGAVSIGATIPFCHVSVERVNQGTTGIPSTLERTWDAVNGYAGDSVGARINRTCVDQGVWPETKLISTTNRIVLGPQTPGAPLTILKEAAQTDAGLLGESTQRVGVSMETRSSLYHRTPIELDYEDSTILNRQLEPYDDDALITNRVVMTDTGSDVSTTQTETEGPLAAIDAPDGIGVRTTNPSVSLRHSALLGPVAQWALAQGTLDAPYFRTLGFNLVKIRDTYSMTALADALEAANLGDHVWIDNPPVWLPRGTNKLVITEVREELSAVNHTLAFAARPGELFGPGIVADDTTQATDVRMQRVDTSGSTIGATADDNDTTLTVYTDLTDWGTRPWTTDSDDWDNTDHGGGGLRIRANGEVMRVTNIAADTATLAHDAATEPATFTTTTPATFTHTPVGTPKGVLVFIDHGTDSTDRITAVTYGGVAMTRVRTAADTATEPGRVYLYFLGSGIPTGAQTVSITHDGGGTVKHAVSVTLTALGDTQVRATTNLEGDQANPQAAFDPDGRMSAHYCVVYSGAAAPSSLTVLSGMTAVHDHDFGNFASRVDRQTTPGTGAFTIGYTASSDDVAFIAVQVGTTTASQAFTVSRGVEGFATGHAVGDTVAVAHPARVGL